MSVTEGLLQANFRCYALAPLYPTAILCKVRLRLSGGSLIACSALCPPGHRR